MRNSVLLDKKISVTYMSGPLDGKILRFDQPEIGEESVLTIGRREGCDIYLPFDNQVSRLHARLGCDSLPITSTESVTNPFVLMFWLEDAHSRNGTFVEKEKDPLRGRVNLRPGTLFRIGRTWLRLDIPFSFDGEDPLF
jgi:pSer/pThr/pTyr-binding forkhead associated (FHA) protein